MDKKAVSVFMLTYNQDKYIAQAINGVLMQKTDFPFELVIGEDCSTDKTREICIKYAEKNTDKIKLILNEENLGLGKNYVKTYSACTGKYVAICDGDDYWIDPYKLQNQFDFLENNPDYSIVFTNNKNIYPSGNDDVRDEKTIPEISSFTDIVKANFIASVTVMFKNCSLNLKMQELIEELPYGDWPTYLWVLKDGGKIKFMNEVTAVYRKDFGTSTSLRKIRSKIGETNLLILKALIKESAFQEQKECITKSILKNKTGLMATFIKEGKYLKSFVFFTKLVFKNPWQTVKIYLFAFKRLFYGKA